MKYFLLLGFLGVASASSGCMDPNAINYDLTATEQAYDEWGGMLCNFTDCTKVPESGCLLSGVFIKKSIQPPDCDCLEFHGEICDSHCMDPNAINYVSTATEQAYGEWGEMLCTFADCTKVPENGCLFPDSFVKMSDWGEHYDCLEFKGEICCECGYVIVQGRCVPKLYTQVELDNAYADGAASITAFSFNKAQLKEAYASHCN